jgi:DtxR family Mn-dependent transcriptional regulator
VSRTATRSSPASGSRACPWPTPSRARRCKILRFENEAEELLHLFKAEGFEPGREGVISESDSDLVTVDFDGTTASLTRSVAETVSVIADPSPPVRTALPEQLVLSKDRYGR